MNKLKFSHDYKKLPVNWEGTQALFVGVSVIEDMDRFKKSVPQLIELDTAFRGETGNYPLNFKKGIILTFFHFASGKLFTTIRRWTVKKFEYYIRNRCLKFELVRI